MVQIFIPNIQNSALWQIVTNFLFRNDYLPQRSSSYSEMQGLLETVIRHAVAVGMRIDGSKTNVMSTLIPDEQHQVVLLDGEPLEDVD